MATTTNPAETRPDRLTPGARRALLAAMIGTLIEWYDYALYGAAAGLVITPLFFPGTLASAGDMAAFATFAVGFVVRPLGGVVMAHVGDRYGRKPALLITIALMGLATVGIGVLPTAAAIGIAAPVLLVALRILQGFGAGAELAGAMTVVAEFAPPRRRGFFTGLVLSAPPAGTTIATLAFLAVSALPSQTLLDGAWRIPFLVSAVLFALAVFIRRRMEETPEYARAREVQDLQRTQAVPAGELLANSWRRVVLGFLSVTGHNANNYLLATFSLSYLTKSAGMGRNDALLAVIVGSLCGVVASPFGGMLADRIGAGRVMALGSVLGILYAFPLFLGMRTGNLAVVILVFAIGYGIVLAMTSGAQGAFLTNLFPVRYRFSGVAVSRELNGALVAGMTPLVAEALIRAANGGIHLAAAFLLACFAVTLGAVLAARGAGDRPHAEPADEPVGRTPRPQLDGDRP